MLFTPICRQVLVALCLPHVTDMNGRRRLLGKIGLEYAHQVLFLLIPEHQIHAPVFFQALRRRLRVAARRDHNSSGI